MEPVISFTVIRILLFFPFSVCFILWIFRSLFGGVSSLRMEPLFVFLWGHDFDCFRGSENVVVSL